MSVYVHHFPSVATCLSGSVPSQRAARMRSTYRSLGLHLEHHAPSVYQATKAGMACFVATATTSYDMLLLRPPNETTRPLFAAVVPIPSRVSIPGPFMGTSPSQKEDCEDSVKTDLRFCQGIADAKSSPCSGAKTSTTCKTKASPTAHLQHS